MNRTARKAEIVSLKEEKIQRKKYNAILRYKPYPKQLAFHNMQTAERALGAGNQLGKSTCGSSEISYHATGLYPDWWQGKRFKRHTIFWIGGETGDVIRNTTQKLLVGRIHEGDAAMGTGSIPRDRILELAPGPLGEKGSLDHVKVLHVTGQTSLIYFKSYAMGRQKWQGDTIDGVWFDEEPPYDIYSEGRERTSKGQLGWFTMLSFTPLLGMTEVVTQFYKTPTPSQGLVMMTIDDVEHYTEEEKARKLAGYRPWERDARAMGIPILGSGRVFNYAESDVKEPHIIEDAIPSHWALLNALDFGWDHPQACVQIAWDKDSDIIHVIRGKKARETTPETMWVMVKGWVKDIPTAWPPDGLQHEKGSGEQVKAQYGEAGFNMLDDHSTHEEGGTGVEAGLVEMHERFSTKRLLIDETLEDFWDEYRLYHRKDGKLVKINDDLISAVRYAIMMKRFAVSPAEMAYVHHEPAIFPTDMPI